MKIMKKNKTAGFTLIEYVVSLVLVAIVAAMLYGFFGSSLSQSIVPIQRLQKASELARVMENISSDYDRLNTINMRYVWKAATAYRVDSCVVPATNNGYYYKCITAGISAAMPPSWPAASGATVADGGVVWRNTGKVWRAATSYAAGDLIVPYDNNGHYYKCTSAGTSVAQPVWPRSDGGTVNDGGAAWAEAGTILASRDEAIENLFTLLPAKDATSARYGTGYKVTFKDFIRFDSGNNWTTSGVTEKDLLKVTIKDDHTGITLTSIFTVR